MTMELARLSLLFALTALAEIIGCYLPWLTLKQGYSAWLLVPAALSLAVFALLLTLQPAGCVQGVCGSGSMAAAVTATAALRARMSRSFCAILISRPRSTGW